MQYISPKELAAQLRVHENSVRRWVRTGKLPAWKIGGRIFIIVNNNDTDRVLREIR